MITLAWLNHSRHLGEDYEIEISTALAEAYLKFIFFSVVDMVTCDIDSIYPCSTVLSASSRSVHLEYPSGGSPQASAMIGDQYGLQSAASIIWECSTDDGFYNFLPWLIAQGKDVYLMALKDPDSLADIEPYGSCEIESLACAGTHALTAMLGPHQRISALYDDVPPELEEDIVYGEGIGYPYEWDELPKYVPHLCAKYLTMEELADKAEKDPIWNPDNPDIQP